MFLGHRENSKFRTLIRTFSNQMVHYTTNAYKKVLKTYKIDISVTANNEHFKAHKSRVANC